MVGVAGLGLSMKELSELIHNFSFGERGKVYLVRSDGLIQVHPEAQLSGKRSLTEQIGATAAQAVMGQKTATTSNRHTSATARPMPLLIHIARRASA